MLTISEQLLKAIKARTGRRSEFGHGITTADKYVRTIADCCGPQLERLYPGQKLTLDSLLKEAGQKLVYSNPDMTVEVKQSEGDFSDVVPEGVELPPNTLMVFRHVLTTPRKDRDNDVLRTEGAQVDPKMLLLWQHIHTLPIGKLLAVQEHTPEVLRNVSAIVDINELAHDAAVMIDNGMGRFSHGFRAFEFVELKVPEGGEETGPLGFEVLRFEIMEESLVSVPSNADAETEDILLSLVGSKQLKSDVIKTWADKVQEKRPVAVPMSQMKLTLGDAIIDIAVPSTEIKTHKADDPSAEKRLETGSIDGSWEWIERELHDKAKDFVESNGISVADRFVWIAATFPDHAILCAEHEECGVKDEFLYFKATWELGDDGPRFTGDLEPVAVTVSIEVLERSPLHQIKQEAKRAVPFSGTTPSEDTEWDAGEAVGRLRSWAGVTVDEPTDTDWATYQKGFGRVIADGNKLADFSLPHHDIEDGELVVNRSGVSAAIGAVNGSRSNINFESESEREAVYAHLAKHLTDQFDTEPPEFRSLKFIQKEHEQYLLDAGEMLDDLKNNISSKAGRVLSERNMTALSDVIDDLKELSENDALNRAQKLLLKAAIGKIETILDSARPAQEETSVTPRDAARLLLCEADTELLCKTVQAITAILAAKEQERLGEQYRELVSL